MRRRVGAGTTEQEALDFIGAEFFTIANWDAFDSLDNDAHVHAVRQVGDRTDHGVRFKARSELNDEGPEPRLSAMNVRVIRRAME